MRKTTFGAALALAIAVAGCGDDLRQDPTGPATGGGGAGGGGAGGGGAGGGGAGGGDEPLDCDPAGEASLGEVTISITNGRAESVFYHHGQGDPERCDAGYEVKFASLPEAQSDPITTGCFSGPLDCNPGAVVELASGQTATFTWSGLLWEHRNMPAGCEHGACFVAVAPEAGEVGTVSMSLFEACASESNCTGPIHVEAPLTYGEAEVALEVTP